MMDVTIFGRPRKNEIFTINRKMHWEPLDLGKASSLKKEVDAIVANFELIPLSNSNGAFADAGESFLLPMLHSINERISQLESFCTINCDGDVCSYNVLLMFHRLYLFNYL